MFTLTKIVPQDRESTSQRIQDCLLRVKTTQLTHPELNAFLETHVTEVGRPKGESKINLELLLSKRKSGLESYGKTRTLRTTSYNSVLCL